MAKEHVMTRETFQKFSNRAAATLITLAAQGKAPKMSDREAFREAYAKEVAALYLPKIVSPADVLIRWGSLKSKGGFILIPEGVKGKKTDMAAVNAETEATKAALDAAGVKYTIDGKGNIVIA